MQGRMATRPTIHPRRSNRRLAFNVHRIPIKAALGPMATRQQIYTWAATENSTTWEEMESKRIWCKHFCTGHVRCLFFAQKHIYLIVLNKHPTNLCKNFNYTVPNHSHPRQKIKQYWLKISSFVSKTETRLRATRLLFFFLKILSRTNSSVETITRVPYDVVLLLTRIYCRMSFSMGSFIIYAHVHSWKWRIARCLDRTRVCYIIILDANYCLRVRKK